MSDEHYTAWIPDGDIPQVQVFRDTTDALGRLTADGEPIAILPILRAPDRMEALHAAAEQRLDHAGWVHIDPRGWEMQWEHTGTGWWASVRRDERRQDSSWRPLLEYQRGRWVACCDVHGEVAVQECDGEGRVHDNMLYTLADHGREWHPYDWDPYVVQQYDMCDPESNWRG